MYVNTGANESAAGRRVSVGEILELFDGEPGLTDDAAQRTHGDVRWRGTITTTSPRAALRMNFTWLPLLPTSENPAASSLRRTSRYESGLSGSDFGAELPDPWCTGGARRLEVQLDGFLQVG